MSALRKNYNIINYNYGLTYILDNYEIIIHQITNNNETIMVIAI